MVVDRILSPRVWMVLGSSRLGWDGEVSSREKLLPLPAFPCLIMNVHQSQGSGYSHSPGCPCTARARLSPAAPTPHPPEVIGEGAPPEEPALLLGWVCSPPALPPSSWQLGLIRVTACLCVTDRVCHLQERPLSVAGAASVALLQCWWLFCAFWGMGGVPGAGTSRIPPAPLRTGWTGAPHLGVDGWRSPAQPVPEDHIPSAGIAGKSKCGHNHTKMMQILQKLHQTQQLSHSSHPSQARFWVLCSRATPAPPLWVSPGLGTCCKVWLGKDLQAQLVPNPFHQPTAFQQV